MKFLKNTVFFFIFLFAYPFEMNAAHIVGGEMTYECLGNDNYRITLNVWRDCLGGGAPFDSDSGGIPGSVTVYHGSDQTPFETIYLDKPDIIEETLGPGCPNVFLFPEPCLEKGAYKFEITLPNTGDSYHITYQRCCRNSTISNLSSPSASGMTFSVMILPEAMDLCNWSPTFNKPGTLFCADKPFDYFFEAEDSDGDSLVWEFCPPLLGGGVDNQNPFAPAGVAPDPDLPPPYTPIQFHTVYSEEHPFAADPPESIDPQSGFLSGTPKTLGIFQYAVCIKEYRNGVLLSEIRRDIQAHVVWTLVNNYEIIRTQSLKVFPNPASDEVFVEIPDDSGVFEIKVFNSSGRLLHAHSYEDVKNLNIKTTEFSRGIYFITLTNGNHIYRSKFVVR